MIRKNNKDNYEKEIKECIQKKLEKLYPNKNMDKFIDSIVKKGEGLFLHDCEDNEFLAKTTKRALECFGAISPIDEKIIMCVNLFDAQMGMGELIAADETSNCVFMENDLSGCNNINAILHICKANLLLVENRVFEAFNYYEQGIKFGIESEFSWEEYYGKIWREFALIKVGNEDSLKNLLDYSKICQNLDYSHLASLALTFYILGCRINGVEEENIYTINESYKTIKKFGDSGHIAEAGLSIYMSTADLCKDSINDIVDKLLSCEGIKGCFDVVCDFVYNFSSETSNLYRKDEILKWCNKYINPIIEYRKSYVNNLKLIDQETPKLQFTNCVKCPYNCCYDGVYLEEDDEKRIKIAMEKHPEYFSHILETPIVDGNWLDKVIGRKTNVVYYEEGDKWIKHFNKTRCIFAYEDGKCSLQCAATENFLNPWKYKPCVCCLFPLNIVGEKIAAPHTDSKNDPCYVDEKYPGFSSSLPCCKKDCAGIEWSKKYLQEVFYADYCLRNKKL